MLLRVCVNCEEEFDLHSEAKRQVGGLAVHCPDCSEETAVRYAGVQAADGKQAQATVLKFESNNDRNRYIRFWQAASGLHKSKSCQISRNTPTTPKINFETIIGFSPTNHKGKI